MLALVLPLLQGDVLPYLWSLAALHCGGAVVALVLAAPHLEREWVKRAVGPALSATVTGCVAVQFLREATSFDGASQLLVAGATYGLVVTAIAGLTARTLVAEMVRTYKGLVRRPFAARTTQTQGANA
jgi:hypothetical protein